MNVTTETPYAEGQHLYLEQGWTGILPVYGKAGGLPVNTTGRDGQDPDPTALVEWVNDRPDSNLALRVPNTVVGIDVDGYKGGGETLRLAVAEWGHLPKTWRSTARGDTDGVSGIYFFRIPEGVELSGIIEFDGSSAIETIQFHHRFAVAWPSIHPDTKTQYKWYRPEGMQSPTPPSPDSFPELPTTWLEGLQKDSALPAHDEVNVKEQRCERDLWDTLVIQEFEDVRAAALGEVGSRHDHAMHAIMALARSERRGKAGATTALEDAVEMWAELMGEERGDEEARKEALDLVAGGRRLASTTPTLANDTDHIDWYAQLPEPQPEVDVETGEVMVKGLSNELLGYDGLQELPPPVPLLEGWLYRHTVASLSAAPKSGKTFVALEMMLCLASGIAWAGGRIPHRGKVLYIIGEGVSGVGQRVQAWSLAHPHANPGDNIKFLPRAVPFRDPAAALELIELARAEKYDAIVIDTLARAAIGMEENSAKEMGQVVGVLDKLKAVSDACVLIVHHTGKDASKGLRGSSALAGAIDTSLIIEGTIASNMHLKTDFQKDASSNHEIQLRAKLIGHSLVLERADTGVERSDHETKALEVLQWGGVPVTRSEWKDQMMEHGYAKATAYTVIGGLIRSGAVVSPDDPDSRSARFTVVI